MGRSDIVEGTHQCGYHWGPPVACRLVQLRSYYLGKIDWTAWTIWCCANCRGHLRGHFRYARRQY